MQILIWIFIIGYAIHSIFQPSLNKDALKYVSSLILIHDGVYKNKMFEIQLHVLAIATCILAIMLYIQI